MRNTDIMRVTAALDLRFDIVGIRFLDFKEDYDTLDLPVGKPAGPFCYHIRKALDGEHFKLTENDVTCDYARYAVGLSRPDNMIAQGRSYEYCGLYESKAVAKEVTAAMKYIEHNIYGVEAGPLKEMENADIVIIADNAEAVMRVIQGYAYRYGVPKNLSFYGNQAMCSDMVSKPFSTNDINISLLCKGTRKSGRFEKGDISVAFPIHMFYDIAVGIIMTVNPVHTPKDKARIMNRLGDSMGLGVEIDDRYNYGIGLKEYDNKIKKSVRNNTGD